jgi:hypothetical protein
MTMLSSASTVLSDELFEPCSARAATYDRENRFFTEDSEAHRDAGYLRMAVPSGLGRAAWTWPRVCAERRRLAYHAAPTAHRPTRRSSHELIGKSGLGVLAKEPRW